MTPPQIVRIMGWATIGPDIDASEVAYNCFTANPALTFFKPSVYVGSYRYRFSFMFHMLHKAKAAASRRTPKRIFKNRRARWCFDPARRPQTTIY